MLSWETWLLLLLISSWPLHTYHCWSSCDVYFQLLIPTVSSELFVASSMFITCDSSSSNMNFSWRYFHIVWFFQISIIIRFCCTVINFINLRFSSMIHLNLVETTSIQFWLLDHGVDIACGAEEETTLLSPFHASSSSNVQIIILCSIWFCWVMYSFELNNILCLAYSFGLEVLYVMAVPIMIQGKPNKYECDLKFNHTSLAGHAKALGNHQEFLVKKL